MTPASWMSSWYICIGPHAQKALHLGLMLRSCLKILNFILSLCFMVKSEDIMEHRQGNKKKLWLIKRKTEGKSYILVHLKAFLSCFLSKTPFLFILYWTLGDHCHINGSSLMNSALQPLPTCPALLDIILLLTADNPFFFGPSAVLISGSLGLQGLEAGFRFPSQRLKLDSCNWAPNPSHQTSRDNDQWQGHGPLFHRN